MNQTEKERVEHIVVALTEVGKGVDKLSEMVNTLILKDPVPAGIVFDQHDEIAQAIALLGEAINEIKNSTQSLISTE